MALVVEDGTGRTDAQVYDTTDDVAAWLGARNPRSPFVALDLPGRERALLKATELAERHAAPRFQGRPLTFGPPRQALLFPADGAYAQDLHMFNRDERPVKYRQGIMLLADPCAAGTEMPLAANAAIAEVTGKRTAVRFRDSLDPASLAANHPEEWALIRSALPR